MQNEPRKIGHYGAYDKTGATHPPVVWTPDMARALAQKYDVAHLSRNEYSLLLRDLRRADVITPQEFSAGYGGTVPHGRISVAPPEPLPFGDDSRTDFVQLLEQYVGYCGECLKAPAGTELAREHLKSLLSAYSHLYTLFKQIHSAGAESGSASGPSAGGQPQIHE